MSKAQFIKENLKKGELLAGLILGKNGDPDYHLVLLPGQAADVNHKDATTWAKKAGGELPTRREQSLLFANLKEEFEQRAYWSSELYEPDSGYAWYQYFFSGYQRYFYRYYGLRARAVRRLFI